MPDSANSRVGRDAPLARVQGRQRRSTRLPVEADAAMPSGTEAVRGERLGGCGGCTTIGAPAKSAMVVEPRAPRAGGRSRSRASARLSAAESAVLAEIQAEPMDFMDHPEFHRAGAQKRIYDQAPAVRRPDVTWYRPMMEEIGSRGRDGGPRRHDNVVLTAAEERVVFMQFNYARFRVRSIQEKLRGKAPDTATAREMLRWHGIAQGYREQIAETNLALVLAMAKRVRLPEGDFGDLISEGNMAMMRAVDKFDCGRGFKFSTYACRAILKAFSRHGIKLAKHRQRFPTEFDPEMERSNHAETVRATALRDSAAEVRDIVERNRAELSEMEHAVIMHRFGLDGALQTRQPTLEQVGELIGVTKERVRQIQNRALEKLRLAIEGARPAPGAEPALAASVN